MKKLVFVLLFSLSFVSCKQTKEEMLTGKWQAVSLSNPQDEIIKNQQAFIDSFGKNNTPDQNMLLYGTANTDSLRSFYQAQLDSFLQMFQYTINNTRFEFRDNKIAIVNIGGHVDSANWYFDKQGNLVLDDEKMKATGEKTQMEILMLTQDSLRLRFSDEGVAGVASFHRVAQ